MASRFWVGGTGTWDAADTTHWAASSGGAGGESVPGASDTVTFDGSSGGGTVTPDYDMTVVSITMGAFTGALDFSTNNNSPTMSTFNCSGTGTRTLNMGSGTWTLTGTGTVWTTATTTNMALVEGTSTINLSYSGSTSRLVTCGSNTTGRVYNLKISAGTGTVTLTNTGCNNLDFTGFAGTVDFSGIPGTRIGGSLTLAAGMTGETSMGLTRFDGTSGTHTITTFGHTIGTSSNNDWVFEGVGGTWTLQDSLVHARGVQLTGGTLDFNNEDVTAGFFTVSGSSAKTLNMGSSTLAITQIAATDFITASNSNLTLNAGTSLISCTGASNSPRLVVSDGTTYTFYDIALSASGVQTTTVTGPFVCNTLTISGTSTGNVNISGSNTIGTLAIGTAPRTVLFAAGTTQTITTLSASGTAGNLMTLKSQTDDSTWYLSKASGEVVAEYASLQDSAAQGGALWLARNSTNVSNNSGWTFRTPISKNSASFTNISKNSASFTNITKS